MKKTIYLTGPMRKFSAMQKEEFDKAKQFLESQGQTVQTALDLYEGYDVQSDGCPMDKIMKQRLSELLKCDMVVCLTDYEQDLWACHEVRTARFLNIEVRGIIYMLKLTQNENRNDSTQTSDTASIAD